MRKTITAINNERPFEPSWIDRFIYWVKKLPVQSWVFFSIFGSILILIQIFFYWLEEGLQDINLLPIIIFNGIFTPFLLLLIYLLDNQAVTALNTMRSVLTTTDSEYQSYHYNLSTMPARAPLIFGLSTIVFTILLEQMWVTPIRYAMLEQLQIFPIIFQIIDKSSAFLFGVFIYHTVRQLRLVNTITVHHIRINLFHLRPVQAFSRLTASTAVGLIVGVYGWILINPDLLTDPVILGFLLIITILAIIVFVWPLYGVHRRIEAAKDQVLIELDHRFETALSMFQTRYPDDDSSAIEKLNGTIASLEILNNRVKSIPTWPWKPETLQAALTAIVLPLVLAIVQFLVELALIR